MYPRSRETIHPLDKAYIDTGHDGDKLFTENTYDVYNYNSPDAERDLNKQETVARLGNKIKKDQKKIIAFIKFIKDFENCYMGK